MLKVVRMGPCIGRSADGDRGDPHAFEAHVSLKLSRFQRALCRVARDLFGKTQVLLSSSL